MNYQNIETEALVEQLTEIMSVLLVRDADAFTRIDGALAYAVDSLIYESDEPHLHLVH